MIKKVAVLTCVVILASLFIGSHLFAKARSKAEKIISYMETKMSADKDGLEPEATVDEIRKEIAGLDEEMKKYRSAVAEETVAVDDQREEIARAEENHLKQLELIKIMRKDIAACEESGDRYVTYGDQKYTLERVRSKLARDWDSYKKTEDAIKNKRQILEAREVSLTTARESLAEVRTRKEELGVQLAQLEAELKSVRLAESRSDIHFDDSKLGDIQKDMAKVRHWIKVKTEELQTEGKHTADPIPVGKKNTTKEDMFKEIDAALETKSAGKLATDR